MDFIPEKSAIQISDIRIKKDTPVQELIFELGINHLIKANKKEYTGDYKKKAYWAAWLAQTHHLVVIIQF